MENVHTWFCCSYGCYAEGSSCVFDNHFMRVAIKDRHARFLSVSIDYHGTSIHFL